MIFTKQPLHLLTVTYGAVAGVLAFLGVWSLYKKRQKETGEGAGTYCGRRIEATGISPELVMAGILILIQLVVVVLYAHMDEDDAFYVGTATTAVETDSLYAYNPYTGAAYNVLPSRYILSPFPAFLAVTSRVMRRTSSSHCGTYWFSGGIDFSGICGAFFSTAAYSSRERLENRGFL